MAMSLISVSSATLTATLTATTPTIRIHGHTSAAVYAAAIALTSTAATPEKRKVGSSTLPLTTLDQDTCQPSHLWKPQKERERHGRHLHRNAWAAGAHENGSILQHWNGTTWR
jgi:hypothetical protein